MKALVHVCLFFGVLCCLSGSVRAQNRVLTLHAGDTSNAFVRVNADSKSWLTRIYTIPPVPTELSRSIPVKIDYNDAMNRLLNSFQFEHLLYGEVLPAYTFFGLGNCFVLAALVEPTDESDRRHSVDVTTIRRSLFARPELLELAYTWAMPLYQKAFALMSRAEQNDLLAALEATRAYAGAFDMTTERSALDSVTDFASSRGKLNAFIFRRIANGELTKQECMIWLDRCIRDLQAMLPASRSKWDQFVACDAIGNDHYLCAEYKAIDLRRRSGSGIEAGAVYHATRSDTTAVPDASFKWIDFTQTGMIVGIPSGNGDDSTLIFRCDSSGYRSVTVPRTIAPVWAFTLGEGSTARLLLTDDPGGNDSADCSLVDLDTARLVLEHIRTSFMWMTTFDLETDAPSFVTMMEDRIFRLIDPDLYGLLGADGNILLEPKYTDIRRDQETNEYILDGKTRITLRE